MQSNFRKFDPIRCIECGVVLCTRVEEKAMLCVYHYNLKLEKEKFVKLQLHKKFEYLFDKLVEAKIINV